MIKPMVKEHLNMLTEINFMESGMTVKNPVMEYITTTMVQNLKDNDKMMKKMEEEHFFMQMVINM